MLCATHFLCLSLLHLLKNFPTPTRNYLVSLAEPKVREHDLQAGEDCPPHERGGGRSLGSQPARRPKLLRESGSSSAAAVV